MEAHRIDPEKQSLMNILESLDLGSSEIDDKEFNIPKVNDIPTVESILNDEDVSLLSEDDVTVCQRKLKVPWYDSGADSASLGSSSSSHMNTEQLTKCLNLKSDPGRILRHTILKPVSNQMHSFCERFDAGQPSAIRFSLLIAIGTSKGFIILFDSLQTFQWYHEAVNCGAVSAIDFNHDCSRLIVGYINGTIIVFDSSSTTCKTLRVMNDSHTPGTTVLHIKFSDLPNLAIVNNSAGSVFELNFKRNFGIRSVESKCLFSGGRGKVCCIEPLLFNQLASHPMNGYVIIAMATLSKVIIVTIRPNTELLLSNNITSSRPCLPLLSWQFVIIQFNKTSNSSHRIMDPVLAFTRDDTVYFYQVNINDQDGLCCCILQKIKLSYTILACSWMNARTLLTMDSSDKVYLVDVRVGDEMEQSDLLNISLVYTSNYYNGTDSQHLDKCCYSSVHGYNSQLVLLGKKRVHIISIRSWIERLDSLTDKMVWFRENWYEEVLRQLRLGLAKCYNIAFDSRGSVADAQITPHTLNFIKKLVSTFGIGIELLASNMAANSAAISTKGSFPGSGSESLAKRAQTTIQDPVFQKMKQQFSIDFDFTLPAAMKLHHMISKMKKWIKILETKIRLLPKSFLIEEKCRFLSNFSLQTAEIEIPGEFLLPKHSHYYVKIARFMPRVQIVEKHNTSARRLVMRGHNGKLYSYLVMHDAGLGDTRREERVLQLLRMLNHYLTKQKETSRRFLYYTVPRVVAVSPQQRLVEDNPSSLSLLDIFKSMSTSQPYDDCIEHYYQRLANIQNQGTQANIQMLLDVFLEVQQNYCQSHILKNWATLTYASPTDYWTFRKMLTLQLSLSCLAEYVLHLTRLNPDMMYIHQDSGLLNASYFKFDVDDKKGELVSNRPVPFRLTPNFVELMTDIGKNGPLTASIMATARCFNQPNNKVQAILRAILRDEMITSYKKKLEDELSTDRDEISGDIIISMVTKAVNSIMHRLNSLANFDGTDNKVSTIVSAASSVDNLCRMDPAWYPWL
ncbi:transformation/transcription domain-associated protein [Acyrthosiphon pisum]|uniref:Non-specific serine/threonine protein kinase n=1 Tax=Acyrthosiphon pisum TaxID=7029 RepID=A0A8R2NL98_ACYPI|nr:transformation/transcription domain-associated protein [Acyrthosiphon pisum]